MKLPFTEQFLWDLYKFFYGDPDKPVKRFMPISWSGLVYPEYCKLVEKYKSKKDSEAFRKLIHYLKKRGWIEFKIVQQNKEAAFITQNGRKKVLRVMRKIKSPNFKKRKDGKWHMIMYDIPKGKEKERWGFRGELKLLGYQMIQKSIWASPYNIFKETQELIEEYRFQDYVRFLLVQEIEIH